MALPETTCLGSLMFDDLLRVPRKRIYETGTPLKRGYNEPLPHKEHENEHNNILRGEGGLAQVVIEGLRSIAELVEAVPHCPERLLGREILGLRSLVPMSADVVPSHKACYHHRSHTRGEENLRALPILRHHRRRSRRLKH